MGWWSELGPTVKCLLFTNTAIFVSWQFARNNDKTLQRKLYEDFMVTQEYTFRGQRYHNVLTYSVSHTNPLHYLANVVPIAVLGAAVERAHGPMLALNLLVVSASVGFLSTWFLYESGNNYVNVPSMKGGGCYTAALSTYVLLDTYMKTAQYTAKIPLWISGIVMLGLECAASKYFGGNINLSPEIGGVISGFYYYILRKIILRY
jgi:membrane associated rhomboid family serine protease